MTVTDQGVVPLTQELRPYSVWLTGPELPGPRLLNAIARANGRCWHEPVMQIVAPAPQALATARALWRATPPWDFYLFTSRAAVAAVRDWGPVPAGAQFGAVGQASAEAVTSAFGRPCFAPASDAGAAALLTHPALAEVAGRRILVLQGVGGRDLLDVGLRERAADVAVARVYLRAAAAIELAKVRQALTGQAIISLASIDIAKALASMAQGQNAEWPLTSRVLAWSPRIGAALGRIGYRGHLVSAETATPVALFAALLDLAKRDPERSIRPSPCD